VESDLRLISAVGNSNVIAAAVAAMGLVSTSAHASTVGDDVSMTHLDGSQASMSLNHFAEQVEAMSVGSPQAGFNLGLGYQAASIQPASFHIATPTFESNHSLIGSEVMVPVEAPSFPLASSGLPAGSAILAAAPMVAMPSAEMLAAAFDGSNLVGSSHAGDAAGVLAEVLAGGHSSPIDAMLEAALPQHGGGGHMEWAPIDHGFAPLGDLAIASWNGMSGFGSPTGHPLSLEMAVIHPDMVSPA
jgi:hypothetical protein